MSLEELRKQYRLGGLRKSDMQPDPFKQFESWFQELVKNIPADWFEPNAMTLATSEGDNVTARIVLLKGFDANGFMFFTNYDSSKATQLAANPKAALLMYWPFLERQVRIEGTVTKTSRERSEEYFHSRPRGSQLGALASEQSKIIESRETLECLLAEIERQYDGKEVPTPTNWGGYVLCPTRFEFWQGRENRLHDRFEYKFKSNVWKVNRLAP